MNKRWIINLIDSSGSMTKLKDEVVEQYNLFLSDILEEKDSIRWTTYTFNNKINKVCDDIISNCKQLHYLPEGTTSLLDAIGAACNDIIVNTVEYSSIILNIFTDGVENSSTKYTYKSIDDLLANLKTRYNLNVCFYCTTEDALIAPKGIKNIDTSFNSPNFGECMRQMSAQSSQHRGEYSGTSSEPGKKQKIT